MLLNKAKMTTTNQMKPSIVQGPGAPSYSLAQLFSVLRVKLGKHMHTQFSRVQVGSHCGNILRSKHLRSDKELGSVLDAAFELILGVDLSRSGDSTGPSAPTLSRARARLDLAHMLLRREQVRDWKARNIHFMQLCCLILVYCLLSSAGIEQSPSVAVYLLCP